MSPLKAGPYDNVDYTCPEFSLLSPYPKLPQSYFTSYMPPAGISNCQIPPCSPAGYVTCVFTDCIRAISQGWPQLRHSTIATVLFGAYHTDSKCISISFHFTLSLLSDKLNVDKMLCIGVPNNTAFFRSTNSSQCLRQTDQPGSAHLVGPTHDMRYQQVIHLTATPLATEVTGYYTCQTNISPTNWARLCSKF